jgi:hypothetical protein
MNTALHRIENLIVNDLYIYLTDQYPIHLYVWSCVECPELLVQSYVRAFASEFASFEKEPVKQAAIHASYSLQTFLKYHGELTFDHIYSFMTTFVKIQIQDSSSWFSFYQQAPSRMHGSSSSMSLDDPV